MAINGIFFNKFDAIVSVVRIEAGEDEAETIANIIGGVDAQTGDYKGMQAFLSSESIVHAALRVLIAPGFTLERPNNQANPVISSMLVIADSQSLYCGLIVIMKMVFGGHCLIQKIYGIVGTVRPVDFTLGDANCTRMKSQPLFAKEGYHHWGNRSCSSDPRWAFL